MPSPSIEGYAFQNGFEGRLERLPVLSVARGFDKEYPIPQKNRDSAAGYSRIGCKQKGPTNVSGSSAKIVVMLVIMIGRILR